MKRWIHDKYDQEMKSNKESSKIQEPVVRVSDYLIDSYIKTTGFNIIMLEASMQDDLGGFFATFNARLDPLSWFHLTEYRRPDQLDENDDSFVSTSDTNQQNEFLDKLIDRTVDLINGECRARYEEYKKFGYTEASDFTDFLLRAAIDEQVARQFLDENLDY